MSADREFSYDVALSFAGEDRAYVAQVAKALTASGVKVFYDEYETVTLWGKDLYDHLNDVYQKQARFTVLFASRHYAAKVWTNHERRSAQARAISERSEYILPARFDDSEIPGLRSTTGYIDLRKAVPQELVGYILEKLGRRPASWEKPESPRLPGETQHGEESLQERATRLAAVARARESREQFLSSQRAVELAKAEVDRLYKYVETKSKRSDALIPNLTFE